jgi:alpha-tubulin suppressor-like RCC1 family protein
MSQFISNIKHYAVGTMGHYIVIDKNDIASGFGRDDYGQVSSISGKYLTGIKQIEAGGYHTIILFENGRVSGFGRNDFGQSTFGNNLTGVTKIAAGQNHNLAIHSNGKVTGWGEERNLIIEQYAPVNYPVGESISKAGNNLIGVKDISAGYSSSYAVLNNDDITGWGKAKFKYNDNVVINYPLNFGSVKKIDGGYNFGSILLENGKGISIRHYAQSVPQLPFSEIFSSDYDPSFRGLVGYDDYSGYILKDIVTQTPTIDDHLTGINDISAGTDYTIASVTSGFITGWGYAPYDQINFYNKNSLKQEITTQTKLTGAFTGNTVTGLPVCIPAWVFKQSEPNLIPKDSGDFNIKNLKAGWNISAALASGSGLFIIGNEQQFLYESNFSLGDTVLGDLDTIYLNRFPTGDYVNGVFKFDSFNAKLIKYTGDPTGLLNKWPYGTRAKPKTGNNNPLGNEAYPYAPSFFQYLYIEDKQQYPKAIVFANGKEGVDMYPVLGVPILFSFLSGLQITGNTYPNIVYQKSVIFGFLKTGSNPSLGVNNFYFSPQGETRLMEISTSAESYYHKMPTTTDLSDDFGSLAWALVSGGTTGDGNFGAANENIKPVLFSRYLSEYELKNYLNFNVLPQPYLTAEILGSLDFESNKIQLKFGFSENSIGHNIYRKRKDYIEDYSFFSGVINDPDADTVNIVEDYSPNYGSGTGTYLQYKIYPWNSYGSGDYRTLEAKLVTTNC